MDGKGSVPAHQNQETTLVKPAVTLPKEVESLASAISQDKRNEVQSVLNSVFESISEVSKRLNSINVADEKDVLNMKTAGLLRQEIKRKRLDAEKVIDAKRAEVQAKMISYTTEDKLWLKTKQAMQIMAGEIEALAAYKEKTGERIIAERRELEIQRRMVKISALAPEIDRAQFENMSNESFDIFYSGIEAQYNAKLKADQEAKEAAEKADQEARVEAEKKAAAEKAELEAKLKAEQEARIEAEKKAAAEKAEMEIKLKAEREARLEEEKKAAEENARLKIRQKRLSELAKYTGFISDIGSFVGLDEESYTTKLNAVKIKAEAQWEKDREKAAAEKAEMDRLKKIAADKARQEAKIKADREAMLKAGDKEKLSLISKRLSDFELPECTSPEGMAVVSSVKELLGKVVKYVKDQSAKM